MSGSGFDAATSSPDVASSRSQPTPAISSRLLSSSGWALLATARR
jgi:hypothetical protein